jgi:hypothetical protein
MQKFEPGETVEFFGSCSRKWRKAKYVSASTDEMMPSHCVEFMDSFIYLRDGDLRKC